MMKQSTSTRARARQNLLVAAINTALERKLITLECEPVTSAVFEFNLGPYPVIASVADIGFDEVSIHAIAQPTLQGRRLISATIFNNYYKFGHAWTCGWLERRTGKYLQSGVSYHGKIYITKFLSALYVMPLGFGTYPTEDGYDFHKEFDRIFGLPRKRQRS